MKEAPWSDATTLKHADKEERLSMEIKQFEQYISPTKHELIERKQIQNWFQDFIAATLPGSKAVPFGSHITGLCLPGSDMDIDIRGEKATSPKQTIVRVKRTLLKKKKCSYDQLIHVPFAKVPVLTIDSPKYPITVDITVTNPSPSTDRTLLWIEKHPELRPLYFVLKHALLGLQHPRHNFRPMSSKFGGMASYTLVCLIVHFLEIEAEKHGCDPSSPAYYGSLLVEILGFYSSFDFAKTGIQFFEKTPYFSKGLQPAMMILDPDVPDSNVGRSSAFVGELQECFAFLQDTIISKPEQGPPNSILQRIIPVTNQHPLDGTRRLEGRAYQIEPLYMPSSDIWEQKQTEQRLKSRKRLERRHEKRAAKNDQEVDEDDIFGFAFVGKRKRGNGGGGDNDDGYSSKAKHSNKRKRTKGDNRPSGQSKRSRTRR